MDYKDRFKEILRENGMTGKDYAEESLMDYTYYRKSTQKKGRYITNWVRAFVIGYELGKKIKTTASGK